MRNTTSDGTVLQQTLEGVRRRLPPGWTVEEQDGVQRPTLRLRGPDGRCVDLTVIARKGLVPRDVPTLVAGAEPPLLVISSYLGERARELLSQAGASYADATGNLRIVVSSPAIFLEGLGAEHDPGRTPRPLHSLRGAAAGRVVRALVEFAPPLGVRELAAAAATPLATVSRVVTFLETEALLSRNDRKQIVSVDWPALLRRWAKDYQLTASNELLTFLEPRGLSALWPKLKRLRRYAATGGAAGPGIAATRIAMIYVDEPEDTARTLGLVPAEAGANVWLLRPYDDVVFTRTRRRAISAGDASSDVVTVSAAQAVVDLMSSPGRGPQEAEALVEKMKENEHDWRARP
ncbi:MAG: hypothetical protein A2289_21265 [Deltaproteobacteria bacterium RIFOXYA12_FULL_58_15]|nr:MAG: hypothetical protein A2289_21265 [Deltaproteobacteria bacterium RIFOXYA12_FULL_58_15]OGR13672.1 MAG: hypothetical protein A2341_08740 [Deltaproteobacteria bacterium RIFOXYB12_FULL_58_9]